MTQRSIRGLLYVGIVAVVLGLAKLHASEIGDYDFTGSSRFAWVGAFLLLLGVGAYGSGLPDVPRDLRTAVASSIVAAGGAAVAMSALQLLVGDALLPRFVVLGSALLLIPWYVLCTAVARGGRLRAESRDRVFVVGHVADVEDVNSSLLAAPERPAAVVGSMDPKVAGNVAPRRRPLCEAVVATAASVVVLDRVAQGDPAVVSQAASLHEAGVRVRTLSLFYEEWLGKLPLNELERVSLMFDIGEVHRVRYGRVKRIVDVALALLGLPLLAVGCVLVLIGNVIANRGPLLYRQRRVGKNGREFDIVKFRTMRPAASGVLVNEWTAEDDPRITPFGRVLRVTHADELPQLMNILRGDLAIVGPRPEQPRYVAELVEKLPFYDLRHVVRPGLTGWAQVKYGYAGSESDALEKLQYEFFYLRHQSLALDLRIIGRTVRSVLGGEGR